MSILNEISENLQKGKAKVVKELVQQAIDEGIPAKQILEEGLLKKYGVFDPAYVKELKALYTQSDFQLMGAYEIDYLLIVMTVTMLCEDYGLTL